MASKVTPDTYDRDGDYYRAQVRLFEHRDAWIMCYGPLAEMAPKVALKVRCPNELPEILAEMAERAIKHTLADEVCRRRIVEYYLRYIDPRVYGKLLAYAKKRAPELAQMLEWCEPYLSNLPVIDTNKHLAERLAKVQAVHPHFALE